MLKKKRIAMVLTLAVMLAALMALGSAGTAFAQQVIAGVIQCQTKPCVATGAHQVLFEQVGDGVYDKLIAQGGHDHLDARSYTNDVDVAQGSGGHDLLRVNDGDALDTAIGGPGFDVCVVDAAVEVSGTCQTVVYR